MAGYNRLLANARREVNDIYRKCPGGVVHFDYDSQTAKVFTGNVDEKVLIFGDSFKAFARLAHNAKKCETVKLMERMKEVREA